MGLEGLTYPDWFNVPKQLLDARYQDRMEFDLNDLFAGIQPAHVGGYAIPELAFPGITREAESTVNTVLTVQISALTTAIINAKHPDHVVHILQQIGYHDFMRQGGIYGDEFDFQHADVITQSNRDVVLNAYVDKKLYRQVMLDPRGMLVTADRQGIPDLNCEFFYGEDGPIEIRSGSGHHGIIVYLDQKGKDLPHDVFERDQLPSLLFTRVLMLEKDFISARRTGKLRGDVNYVDTYTPVIEPTRRKIDFRKPEEWLAGGIELRVDGKRVIADTETFVSSPEVVRLTKYQSSVGSMDISAQEAYDRTVQGINEVSVSEMHIEDNAIKRVTYQGMDANDRRLVIENPFTPDFAMTFEGSRITPDLILSGKGPAIIFRKVADGPAFKIELSPMGMVTNIKADEKTN